MDDWYDDDEAEFQLPDGWVEPEHWGLMRNVRESLPEFGTILDLKAGRMRRYNPNAIAPHLQWGILDYISDPYREGENPEDPNAFSDILCVLASRQQGKSATAALGVSTRASFMPGSYSAIIADVKDRAEDLFRACLLNQKRMPENIRSPAPDSKEKRQLSFLNGAKVRTLSAEQGNVGIGRPFDNLHLSELPFWDDAAGNWNLLWPAINNRGNNRTILESTPAEMSNPSAEWYRDICTDARLGRGRWRFLFAPFYSSKLNERPWNPEWNLTAYEADLLDKWGPKGLYPESAPGELRYLTLENLAFRRETMAMDVKVRRFPELFEVFYPVDSVTCWKSGLGGSIPSSALDRHRAAVLVPWGAHVRYKQYSDPKPGAIYVIGADPAGWGGGDQAAFQVLEVWDDQLIQVATFSSNEVQPTEFARLLIEESRKWNDAMVICENNGVGLATTQLLHQAHKEGITLRNAHGKDERYHLKNMYYHQLASRSEQVPGWPSNKSTLQEVLGTLIDELMDRLVLRDEETVNQLGSYRRDKDVQESDNYRILNGNDQGMKGRRGKHHWDRVSALMIAAFGSRRVPRRIRVKPEEMKDRELGKALTFAEQRKLQELAAEAAKTPAQRAEERKKRSRYKPTRRRR